MDQREALAWYLSVSCVKEDWDSGLQVPAFLGTHLLAAANVLNSSRQP